MVDVDRFGNKKPLKRRKRGNNSSPDPKGGQQGHTDLGHPEEHRSDPNRFGQGLLAPYHPLDNQLRKY